MSVADHDQKIGVANGLIEAGRLDDAQRLLDEIGQHENGLPATTREKLETARERLKTARAGR